MGIKKGIATTYGIDAPEAYHRIRSVRGENGGSINYEVDVFYNTAARDNGNDPLEIKVYNVPGELRARIGVITELYNILKQEPSYSGSEDIFEPDFFPYINTYITNAYLLSAITIDGIDTNTMVVTDGTVEGRFIIDGYVVSGTLTEAAITNVSINGDGYKNGYITYGLLDGYVTQIL